MPSIIWASRHRCGSICGNNHSQGRRLPRSRPGARSEATTRSAVRPAAERQARPRVAGDIFGPGSSGTGRHTWQPSAPPSLTSLIPPWPTESDARRFATAPDATEDRACMRKTPWSNRCRGPHLCREDSNPEFGHLRHSRSRRSAWTGPLERAQPSGSRPGIMGFQHFSDPVSWASSTARRLVPSRREKGERHVEFDTWLPIGH